MPATVDDLTHDALALTPDQRVVLAHRLLVSVELTHDPEIEAAWEKEIRQRIADADAGRVEAVPAAEVFALLRQIAPDPVGQQS